ncbi:hypothetical protein [Mycolicibacterium sp. P9-22]|uniref:hypothetical protein n=1 Tax=Mycolicibacterium sp. P9-22 TaxID=2024613 RepID=UPI0011EE722C|nr:hypothetical protein [Mycolicibacterium sp. P9-22]KAA0113274.1 hypothetical protein CIW51_23670 [Mycolicibacterium sp. P9-22]
MSFPTLARQVDFPAPTGTFDAERAVAAAIEFCTAHDVARHTRYSVVPRLDQALHIASMTGPDRRWPRMARWSGNSDIEGLPETVLLTDERDLLYNLFVAALPEADWLPPNTVVSVSRWARFSPAMREGQKLGLGWILPVQRELLLVPMPTTRYADGSARVLHCDTGRPAIEWSDGSGRFYLHGTEFDEGLYRAVLGGELSLPAIASIRKAEQRSIAMRYLTFDAADAAGARLLHDNVHRLALPPRLARNLGSFAYFTRLGESQSIQWIDPRTVSDNSIDLRRDAVQEGSMSCL